MTAAPPRTDLVGKLLARALDPACHEAEAVTSATKMVQVARRESVTLPILLNAMAIVPTDRKPRTPAPPKNARPPESDRIMSFGKYRGRTLEEIARCDLGYLRWADANVSDDELADACHAVLEWLKDGGKP